MKPYYEAAGVTIYHGDCREIFPTLDWDVLVTDPPYGYDHSSNWVGKFKGTAISNDDSEAARDWVLSLRGGRPALVFGSWKSTRPEGTKAVLVWDKGPASGMGDLSIPWKPSWEVVFVIGKGFDGRRDEGVLKNWHVVTWSGGETQRRHPNEKPASLLRHLVGKCPPGVIVDPFLGSGSTLRAAKDLGHPAIGIEIEERYCEIAARRLAQEVLDFGETA